MITLIKYLLKPLHNFTSSKIQREFIKLLDKYGNVNRFKHKTIKFLSYYFEVPDCKSFVYQFKDIFVDEIYKFESKREKPVIYDCGANVGMSCLYFKILFPDSEIKAFEADPGIAKILKLNLLSNGINDVQVISKTIWTDNEGVEFNVEGADGGSIYGNDNNKIKVESVRLKDYLEEEAEIDMLKIDVEGAELEVLLDCQNSLSNINNIFVEYHSWNDQEQRLDEILSIFRKNNFRYFIEPVSCRDKPFINKGRCQNMDMQLNIFAYREDLNGRKKL